MSRLTEPVHCADHALNYRQEGERDPILPQQIAHQLRMFHPYLGFPYSQPLCIVRFADAEQGLQRIVSRNDEARQVDKELSSNVEEDEEEVEACEAEDDVDLGDRSLGLKLVEGMVF